MSTPTSGVSTRSSPATRMLIALVAGLAAGLLARATLGGVAPRVAGFVEPIGTLWVRSLQMTVIPLVVSLLVRGLASTADPRATGRLGARALGTFLGILALAGVVSLLLGPALVAWMPLGDETAATLRGVGGAMDVAAVRRMPSLSQMLVDIVPTNPVRAAVDGAMLPLVVFTIAFGLAATRIAATGRDAIVAFFSSVSDALLAVVGWVIRVGPIGVFALATAIAIRVGFAAAGALAYYVAILSGMVILTTGLMYVVALTRGVSLARFAKAVAPAQAVAFSARSSLAALPALLEGARTRLGLGVDTTGVVLPLAVTTLRVSTPIMWSVTIPFLARLYGVPLGAGELILLVVVGILLSFSTPGLPSASLFLMAPFLAGLGIPVEALGLAIAADTIPDLFKGVLNVTGHMASGVVVSVRSPDVPRA